MAKVLERIDDRLREFMQSQHMFFVGTAPLEGDGHINVSPKGHQDTFSVLDEHTVAYLDLTGSGAESLAHIRQNGRIVVMFCAFEGPPQIVRLHGTARIVLPEDSEWSGLISHFPVRPGRRAVVLVDVARVSTSCGFAVPNYRYQEESNLLEKWAGRKSDADLAAYRQEKNRVSIDGLPALAEQESAAAPH